MGPHPREKWMTILDIVYVIASRYNVIFVFKVSYPDFIFYDDFTFPYDLHLLHQFCQQKLLGSDNYKYLLLLKEKLNLYFLDKNETVVFKALKLSWIRRNFVPQKQHFGC